MDQDQNEQVWVGSPLYLFVIWQPCYSCGMKIETLAIATTSLVDPEYEDPQAMDGEVCLLSNVVSLPSEVMVDVQGRHPQYQSRYSETAGLDYLMTVCQCGAHQGDHYVHEAIFNAASYEPETIQVEKLPLEGRWVISCGYSCSSAYETLIGRANG